MRPAIENLGKDKLDLGIFKVSFRKSKSLSVLFEDKIPEQFKELRQEIYIHKLELRKAIEEGLETEGAEIVENKSLQIK